MLPATSFLCGLVSPQPRRPAARPRPARCARSGYQINVTANNGGGTLAIAELGLWSDTGRTIPDGTYRILNQRSGKAFEVSGGSASNGAKIDQWDYSGGMNQKWTLTDQGNGQHQILGVGSGKAVDISGASQSNGASIQWPYTGDDNQQWRIAIAP